MARRNYSNKLNLGAGPIWKKEGWEVLDHSCVTLLKLRNQAWRLPYPINTFDIVFCSHMFEHISHFKIEQVICEINRVMKENGILRILTPDLKKIATAYVNNDRKLMELYIQEDNSGIKTTLGLGQAFVNFIVSAGCDNYLLSSDYSEIIAGYGHVYCYDYEMLSGLLQFYGFDRIRQCSIDDSEIEEHKELRTCPYDQDKDHSLIIECFKREYIPFSYEKALLHTDPYRVKNLVPAHYSPLVPTFKIIGYCNNTFRYFLSKLPMPVKNKLKLLLKR
jgi:SAM-dependent methyltransferase